MSTPVKITTRVTRNRFSEDIELVVAGTFGDLQTNTVTLSLPNQVPSTMASPQAWVKDVLSKIVAAL